MPQISEPTTHDLRVSHHYPFPPETVFDAWLDPDGFGEWMRPGPVEGCRVTIDARVGGRFRVDMISGDEVWEHVGEYVRIERPRVLEFTWVSSATDEETTIVTVELTPKDGGTELVLSHRGFPREDASQKHHVGWGEILEKLESALRRG